MMDLTQPLEVPNNIVDLDELATNLWCAYFNPPEPLSGKDRQELMRRYNAVAKKRNDLSNFKALVFLTPSTRVVFKEECRDTRPPGIGQPSRGLVADINTQTPPPAKIQGGNIIQQIIAHHVSGKSNKEIIALGFNKSTVARQVGEYKKRQLNQAI